MFATQWTKRFHRGFGRSKYRRREMPAPNRPQVEQLEERQLLYAGMLDHAFGIDGMTALDFNVNSQSGLMVFPSYGNGVAVQPDEKIVLVGTVFGPAGTEPSSMLVARLNPNGSLDQTFNPAGGLPGTEFFSLSPSGTTGSAVAIQPDGKIVVAGTNNSVHGFFGAMVVIRLNTDGSPDTSFNSNGIVTYSDSSFEGANLEANAVAIQNDGNINDVKIVVAGSDNLGPDGTEFALVRLIANGSPDSNFEFANFAPGNVQPGLVRTDFPGAIQDNAVVQGLAIKPDGTIVAAGYAALGAGGVKGFAIAEYNPDGRPDADFNAVGRVTTTFENFEPNDSASGVTVQPNGDIVAAGTSALLGVGKRIALARYRPDGTLDPNFGSGGTLITSFPNGTGSDTASGIALQPDGKLIVSGTSDGGPLNGGQNFALARYNPDGSLDTTFSFDGLVTTDLFGGEQADSANAIALAPNGQIVAVGNSEESQGNAIIGVARYNGDSGQLQFSTPSVSVLESAGTVTLPISRTDGATGTVTVDYTISGGSATGGADFSLNPSSGTVTFGDGQAGQIPPIPILDDGTLEGGSETFYVTLSNPTGGATLGGLTTTAVTILDPDMTTLPISATEGQPVSGIVATFKGSNLGVAAGDYSASIAWGDNSTSPGTITSDPNGGFDISGTHTYAEEGTYTPTITVAGADSMSANSQATVADAPLTPTSIKLVVTGHKNFSGPVATFTDADPGGTAGDYTATITWDDGSSSTGTISGTGPFTVSGTHTFGSFSGTHHITIAIGDAGGSKASVTDDVKDPTFNELYVMQLYQDLLQRPPDTAGLAYWSSLLGHGVSRTQVAANIEQSQEYRQNEVQALYAHYLYRNADPAGLAVFTNLLARGGTVEQVAADIVASSEYLQTRGSATNAEFLDALYQGALGRSIDSSGQAIFDRQLAAGASRRDVVSAIFASLEYRQELVNGYYQSILGRPADKPGLATFAKTLASGTRDEAVVADIFGSKEFFSKL